MDIYPTHCIVMHCLQTGHNPLCWRDFVCLGGGRLVLALCENRVIPC